MDAKALLLRDFSVRRWFCSLGVRYITFSISAAKTRSHFSIVPERRGLGEMTGLCQSLHARKIRVTQLHTVPQASPKSPLRNWIHFWGFKVRFFQIYSQSNLRNRIHPSPLSVYISFAFRLAQGKNKTGLKLVLSHSVVLSRCNMSLWIWINYVSVYFYFFICLFFCQKGEKNISVMSRPRECWLIWQYNAKQHIYCAKFYFEH